uniref:Receptor activity-modifying protein 3 n=1 Tax=Sus scrofa TaxID=9823 RepID=A0A8D0QMT3_PIG
MASTFPGCMEAKGRGSPGGLGGRRPQEPFRGPRAFRAVLTAVCPLGECPPVSGCNEKRMLAMLPRCGKTFAEMMKKVEVWKWCNLSEFIVYYESFTNCTEVETNVVGCYWPNPLAQSFITGVHRRYFHNCSVDRQQWQDPPDEILIPLIVVPILLTLAMTGLVVWRSKRAAQVV